MYLEAEVYEMLNWGFAIVMGIELVVLIVLWFHYKFSRKAFSWFIGHMVFFAFAGYKLLEAINTFEHQHPMGSENASLSIGISGVLWAISVACLLIGLSRLLSHQVTNRQ
jgi:RsiW-degrading membrane proteinase PrsW (M82 family)